MQSRDFKREETLSCRGWLGRCARDAGAVVQSPLAAATALTLGEQRHQQDGRKNESSPAAGRSDGRGDPGGARALRLQRREGQPQQQGSGGPGGAPAHEPPAAARSDGRKD